MSITVNFSIINNLKPNLTKCLSILSNSYTHIVLKCILDITSVRPVLYCMAGPISAHETLSLQRSLLIQGPLTAPVKQNKGQQHFKGKIPGHKGDGT